MAIVQLLFRFGDQIAIEGSALKSFATRKEWFPDHFMSSERVLARFISLGRARIEGECVNPVMHISRKTTGLVASPYLRAGGKSFSRIQIFD